MPRVILAKATYDYRELREKFFSIMDRLGGGRINKDCRVLIKPNLLSPAPPEKAILTHPMVVRAAAEYVLERGGVPQVSDSQAMGGFQRVLREGGITEALKGLPVVFKEFRESETVEAAPPFHRIEIASDALHADVVINLPKLKSHTQMFLTLGVKNLFGCVVGMRKPEWHFRTGVDRDMFARLLVLIWAAVRPAFTVIDGILAMEGQGPGKAGRPREIGILAGSDDSMELDGVVCKVLGIEPESLPTYRIGREMGLTGGPLEIEGSFPEVKGFRFPEITPLVFGPKKLHGFMRRHLVQRPVSDDNLCRMCGECWKYCPAAAITPDGKRLRFDYDKCIRCYCCIEVCPHGALTARETMPGKVIRKAVRRR